MALPQHTEPDPGGPSLQYKKVDRGRLVVVEQVHHSLSVEQPTTIESRYVRPLSSDEQAYGPRTLDVGPEWQPVDVGWVKMVGMLCLQNRGDATLEVGLFVEHPVEPTILPGQVAHLCYIPSCDRGMKGESMRLPDPDRVADLRIRCPSSIAHLKGKYTVTAIPR